MGMCRGLEEILDDGEENNYHCECGKFESGNMRSQY